MTIVRRQFLADATHSAIITMKSYQNCRSAGTIVPNESYILRGAETSPHQTETLRVNRLSEGWLIDLEPMPGEKSA